MVLHMVLFLFMLYIVVPSVFAYVCTTEVATPDGNIVTFLDCNPVFEICCEQGCCARFSHAHIWIFTAGLTFLISICIFGCWLFCCKNARRSRTIAGNPQIEDRVDSPLTLVTPDPRNGTSNQNINDVPITPPPTYEEATSMR